MITDTDENVMFQLINVVSDITSVSDFINDSQEMSFSQ